MSSSRRGESNRGFFKFSRSHRGKAPRPEQAKEIMQESTSPSVCDGPLHEKGSLQIQTDDLEQDRNLSASSLASELGDEDDPVKMLVQLQRIRKARGQLSRGLGSATKGVKKGVKSGVKGAMNVATDLHNTTHKAVVGTQEQIGKGAQNVVTSMENVEHGLPRTVATMQGQVPMVNDSTYDEEVATENYLLLHDEIWDDETTTRNAPTLWAILREHQDSIIFKPSSSLQSKDESMDSVKHRKSLYGKEMKKEIRSGLEFSLLHCLVAIVVYLGVAALAYSFVFEQWSIIDSIYFATITFTTIGYGDLVPTSDASRLFTAFFAFTGIAGLGIALGVLGSNLIDAQTKAMDHARELSTYQVMSLFDLPQKLEEGGMKPPSPSHRSALVRGALPIFTLLLLCYWMVWLDFGWNAASTFYFCITTATTVGYGDLAPQTQSERLLAVPFILLAVGAMGQWLSVAANAIIDRRQQEFRKRFETRELTLNDLEVMDDDGDGKVTLAEYLAFMLVAMNKVDQEIVKDLTAQFNRLDVGRTGSLNKEDLIIVAKKKLKSIKRKLQLAQYKAQLLKANSRLQEEKPSALMTAIWSPHSTVI